MECGGMNAREDSVAEGVPRMVSGVSSRLVDRIAGLMEGGVGWEQKHD